MAEVNEDKLRFNIINEDVPSGERGVGKFELEHYEQMLREYREAEGAKTSYLYHCKAGGNKGAAVGGSVGQVAGVIGAGVASGMTGVPIPSEPSAQAGSLVFSGLGYGFGCAYNVGEHFIGNGVDAVGGVFKRNEPGKGK